MIADLLLSKLDKVKAIGKGGYLALCPAHEDKSPSLSVRELDDKVLVHCFAGCSVHEIVAAVDLELSDLFPPRDEQQYGKGQRRPIPAADILRAISSEIIIVYLNAKTVSTGGTVSPTDLERLLLAMSRINAALMAGGINHDR